MELVKNTVYQHDEHGEVLVIAVHHIFDEYDMEAESNQPQSRVVRYTARWDGYGPMPASVQRTPIAEFRNAVGDAIRTVEFTDPGDTVREPE